MALPKINHPIHEVYLKSLDKKIKFRPFLVKEEKILLVAKESDDINDVKNAIKQIIRNCCVDDINVDELPLFDVEMFFVNLRAKSIGENAKIIFTCQNKPEGAENSCGHETEYSVDLNKIEYIVPDGHKKVIQITDKIGVVLKYPTIAIANLDISDAYEATLAVFRDNIDYIYDEDSVYPSKELNKQELEEFIEELTSAQLEEVRRFFVTSPTVSLKDKLVCTKCKFEHDIVVENMYSFFT